MKRILYANGDSFVAGMECIGDDDRSEENKEYAFTKHIAAGLGCKTYINNAYNGATNSFIFNNTIFDLMELEKKGVLPSDVFVVIGFTTLTRVEIDGDRWFSNIPGFDIDDYRDTPQYPLEYRDHKLLFANPNSGIEVYNSQSNHTLTMQNGIIPLCVDYLWTDPVQLPSQEARIIALHEFLKLKGYDHIFVNTCNPLLNTNHVDTACKNFYLIDTGSFYEFGLDNYPGEKRKCGHFSSAVHAKYSEIILEYIQTTELTS